jgi:very-short-patch-repair endonuclease
MARKLTTEEFIEKARKKHGDQYLYDRVVYVDTSIKIEIGCRIHGYFWQVPSSHTSGRNCIKCSGSDRSTTEEFIEKAVKVHDHTYDYSEVEYVHAHDPVRILCRVEGHGSFHQSPSNHLAGKGCPKCMRKAQTKVGIFLDSLLPPGSVVHDNNWEPMGRRRPDFRIPCFRLIVEYDGEQHFQDVKNWKTIVAMIEGYTTIRIPYTSLLKGDDWMSVLGPTIKAYAKPSCIYLEGRTGIYDQHKDLVKQYRNSHNDILSLILPSMMPEDSSEQT